MPVEVDAISELEDALLSQIFVSPDVRDCIVVIQVDGIFPFEAKYFKSSTETPCGKSEITKSISYFSGSFFKLLIFFGKTELKKMEGVLMNWLLPKEIEERIWSDE